ncbi:MAG: hypothetical protein JWO37_1626 [Acidimicrobiales bacterium]|nr:hypothetical protein [Acidimicrobiales bacterium]
MTFDHLVRRFLGSLWPGGPSAAGTEWAEARLLPAEQELWLRMSGPDRRHALAVGHRVERTLGHEATRPVLAAAMLHDVGKTASGLGTLARVGATLVGLGGGRTQARDLQRRRGLTRRIGLYLRHDDIGADMLAIAGSDPLTVAWTREHHRPPAEWTVDRHLAEALKAADDD